MVMFQTPEGPPLVKAAGVALALLRATKTNTWAELVADPDRAANYAVTPEQLELLNEHRGALTMLRTSPPALTLAVCPVCERYAVVTAQAPATCTLTLGCVGKPIRVPAAAQLKPAGQKAEVAEDPDPDPEVDPQDPPTSRVDVHLHVHAG